MEDIPTLEVRAWVDKAVQGVGDNLPATEARATEVMDRSAEVTGVCISNVSLPPEKTLIVEAQAKPHVGQCDIALLPIPDSDVVVRVWPGSASCSEYNVDFFDRTTEAVIDIPTGYALFLLQPECTYLPPQRLMTLDETFGQRWPISRGRGGSYVLRDGQTFALL